MKASLLLFLSSANAATQLDLPQVNNFVSPILYYNILYPVHINCSIPKLMEQSEKFNFQNCLLLWVSHKVQLSGKTFAWRLHLAWNLECVYIYIYIYIFHARCHHQTITHAKTCYSLLYLQAWYRYDIIAVSDCCHLKTAQN